MSHTRCRAGSRSAPPAEACAARSCARASTHGRGGGRARRPQRVGAEDGHARVPHEERPRRRGRRARPAAARPPARPPAARPSAARARPRAAATAGARAGRVGRRVEIGRGERDQVAPRRVEAAVFAEREPREARRPGRASWGVCRSARAPPPREWVGAEGGGGGRGSGVKTGVGGAGRDTDARARARGRVGEEGGRKKKEREREPGESRGSRGAPARPRSG